MQFTRFFIVLLLLLSRPETLAAQASLACKVGFNDTLDADIARVAKTTPATLKILEKTKELITADSLPYKVLPLGPKELGRERLIVGIDLTNAALVQKVRETFQLETPLGGEHHGSLVLEFQSESPQGNTEYVGGILRHKADPRHKIYRFGRLDVDFNNMIGTVFKHYAPKEGHTLYFSHLFGLTEAELKNVKHYLDHPEERAPCKDNCVAWTSSIELGKTAKGAAEEERHHLFSELGMARSSAHFEIGRRLFHAANEKHRVILAWYNGEAGRQAFTDIEKFIPPEPKIPYIDVIRGFAGDGKAKAAVEKIPDGAKVFVPIAAGASPEAVGTLMQHAATLNKGMDIHILVNGVSEVALREGILRAPSKVRLHALFLGGNARKLYADNLISVIPGYLGDFTRFVADPNQPQFHYDAILVRVSTPDELGHHSLGPNNDMIMSIIRSRPGIKIIAEINPNIPKTKGLNFLTANQFTASFESKTKLAGPTTVPLTEVETKIGTHLAQLVPDAAVLQIGIGNIFDYLPAGLAAQQRKGLRIHSEMFGNALMNIMRAGIADKAEVGFAFGSEDLYKWLDRNQQVEFVETEVVNDPARVKNTPNFHAINTALQVNLRGEVNATHGPEGRLSSPGGQVEFMSGASKSVGGKAIIAIRSTAKNNTISTITLDLYGPVTTPAEMVTHVVTEFGIAELRGKSEAERATALIRIAHPNFRKKLAEDAVARKLISAAAAAEFGVAG